MITGLKSREERANLFFVNDDVSFPEDDILQQFSSDIDVDREFELGNKYTDQQKQQILFEDDTARLASQRRQEINNIVSSIADLNFIFKDLGRMIAEQVSAIIDIRVSGRSEDSL